MFPVSFWLSTMWLNSQGWKVYMLHIMGCTEAPQIHALSPNLPTLDCDYIWKQNF